MLQTYGKNLKSVTCIPRDVKISLSFSSSMSTLHVQHTYITVITEFMSCTLLHSAVTGADEEDLWVQNGAYGRLERWRTDEGGKIFWKFFDPGF